MQVTTGKRRLRDGLRLGPAAVRISIVVGVVSLALVGGTGALWFSTGAFDAEPAASRVDRTTTNEPPIRLDTLPATGRPEGMAEGGGPAKVVPVIGVGTEDFADGGEERPNGAVLDVDGTRPTEEIASDAEIQSQLAALERENARIEATLRREQGPASGTGDLIWPVRGPVTSPFGQRWGRLHAGVDIGAGIGTPVHAADSGRVVVSGVVGGYGNYICIQHTSKLSTCYAHNSRLGVRKGESVRKGDVISKSGCTGHCLGPHVHFEVRVGGRPTNPLSYL